LGEAVMVGNVGLPDGQEGLRSFMEKRKPRWKSDVPPPCLWDSHACDDHVTTAASFQVEASHSVAIPRSSLTLMCLYVP
jgi:hypothetical protein